MSTVIARRAFYLCLAAALASPATVSAAPLTPVGVFQHAPVFLKLIVLGLVIATPAAIVICIRKVLSGPGVAGGSAFLSGLRLGGPFAGLVGAAFGGMNMAIGLVNVGDPVPVTALGAGWAEIMMLIFLGLFSGAVAVTANWIVEARIDRAVLTA